MSSERSCAFSWFPCAASESADTCAEDKVAARSEAEVLANRHSHIRSEIVPLDVYSLDICVNVGQLVFFVSDKFI